MNGVAAILRRHVWIAPLAILVVLFLVIGALRPTTFAISQINIKLAAATTLILIATGETIVLLRGGIDLSVGAVLSLATAVAATRGDPDILQSWLWIAFILGLGAGIGLFNGLVISFLQLQPFVVTLATWAIVEGVALIVLPSESSGVPASWVSASYGSYFGLSLAMFAAYQIFALFLFHLFYPNTYAGASLILKIMACFFIFRLVNVVFEMYWVAKERYAIFVKMRVFCGLLSVGLNWIFIPVFGLIAPAVIVVLCELTLTLFILVAEYRWKALPVAEFQETPVEILPAAIPLEVNAESPPGAIASNTFVEQTVLGSGRPGA